MITKDIRLERAIALAKTTTSLEDMTSIANNSASVSVVRALARNERLHPDVQYQLAGKDYPAARYDKFNLIPIALLQNQRLSDETYSRLLFHSSEAVVIQTVRSKKLPAHLQLHKIRDESLAVRLALIERPDLLKPARAILSRDPDRLMKQAWEHRLRREHEETSDGNYGLVNFLRRK